MVEATARALDIIAKARAMALKDDMVGTVAAAILDEAAYWLRLDLRNHLTKGAGL